MPEEHDYKKVDDHTLLETKVIMRRNRLMRLFDFNARQMVMAMQCGEYDDFSGKTSTGAATVFNFADVEGQQVLKDAHAKLTELGGDPPPLERDGAVRKNSKKLRLDP